MKDRLNLIAGICAGLALAAIIVGAWRLDMHTGAYSPQHDSTPQWMEVTGSPNKEGLWFYYDIERGVACWALLDGGAGTGAGISCLPVDELTTIRRDIK